MCPNSSDVPQFAGLPEHENDRSRDRDRDRDRVPKTYYHCKVLYTSPHLDISDPIHSNLLYTHQNVEDNKRNDGKDNV